MKKYFKLKIGLLSVILTLSLNVKLNRATARVVYCSACQTTQDSSSNNYSSVYAELGGIGGIYSLNFDYHFGKQADGAGIRIGISRLTVGGDITTIPIALNHLWSLNVRKTNFVEVGMGVTNIFSEQRILGSNYFALPNAYVGYRYQKPQKVSFRVGLNFPTLLYIGLGIPF